MNKALCDLIRKVGRKSQGARVVPTTPRPVAPPPPVPKDDQTAKTETITRKFILEQAIKTVCSDREQQYGTPEQSFTEIAAVWSWFLGIKIKPAQVAVMMCLFKIARIKTGRFKADNWIDLIGYAACGAELEGLE